MTKSPSPRPLSIKVIAIWHILSCILAVFYLEQDFQILEVIISGGLAFALNVIMLMLSLYVGVGLWRLKEIARRIAIVMTSCGLLIMVLGVIIPTSRATLLAAAPPEFGPSGAVVGLILGLVVASVPSGLELWFLIKRKAAFGKPPTVPQA